MPDEDDALHVALLEIVDPGQDIERTFGQDVGVPVAQPQGSNPCLTQRFREPRIGALAGPAESPPGTPHPDHPVLRLRGRMLERLDITSVRAEHHSHTQLAVVGWARVYVVESNRKRGRVCLARLVV
jgi:hypothetical protein